MDTGSHCTRTRTVTVHGHRLSLYTHRLPLYKDTDCHCTWTQTATVHGHRLPLCTDTDCYCTRTQTATVHGHRLPLYTDPDCLCTRTQTAKVLSNMAAQMQLIRRHQLPTRNQRLTSSTRNRDYFINYT